VCQEYSAAPVLTIIDTAALAGVPTDDYGSGISAVLRWLKPVAREYRSCFLFVDHMAKPAQGKPVMPLRVAGWGSVLKGAFFEFAWRVDAQGSWSARLEATDKRSPVRPVIDLKFDESAAQRGGFGVTFLDAQTASAPASDPLGLLLGFMESGKTVRELAQASGWSKDKVQKILAKGLAHGRVALLKPQAGRDGALWACAAESSAALEL